MLYRHKKSFVSFGRFFGMAGIIGFMISGTISMGEDRGPYPITELQRAVLDKDIEKVKSIIEKDPSEINKIGSIPGLGIAHTPLTIAAFFDYKDIAELLIANGADVNRYSPLFYAVDGNNIDIVRLLFDKGAKIEQKYSIFDNYPQSLIRTAAEGGNVAILKLLMEHGLDIMKGVNEEQYNPLIGAAERGQTEMVEFLISKGVPVNLQTESRSALHEASYYGHLGVVKVLIKNGADVNRKDFASVTPIDYAAYRDYKDVVKYLVENGAYETLFSAVVTENLPKIEQLIEKGQNINVKIRFGDETPLHLAVEVNSIGAARFLISKKAEINAKDLGGDTPLHFAARENRPQIAKILIENGADPNIKNKLGKTAYDIAQNQNEFEITYLFKKYMKKD